MHIAEQILGREEALHYQDKIRRLEDSVSGLRMSRRILMSLLEQSQDEARARLEQSRRDNERLRRQVAADARRIWELSSRLAVLEKNSSER